MRKCAENPLRRRDPVARLGLAIFLGILGLIGLAGWAWWNFTNAPRVHLTLFFRSTVHGVDVGSPVKILGVPVGQIEALGVRLPDEKNPDYYAEVKVVLDGELLAGKGLPRHLDRPAPLKREIGRGLRGRLQLISPMTGDMYLELAYMPEDKAIFVAAPDEGVAEIPTLPDPVSTGIVEFTHRLAELEKRDFAGMEHELDERLDRIHAAVDPANFADANAAVTGKLDEIRDALGSAALKEKLAAMNADLVGVREAVTRYDGQSGKGAEALAITTEKLRHDLAGVAGETEKIGRSLDPRSPSLLMACARIATLRDDAAKVRILCEDLARTNGFVAGFVNALSRREDDGK